MYVYQSVRHPPTQGGSADELGYRAGIQQSSDTGFGVYQEIGFQKLCNMNHDVWVDEADIYEIDRGYWI